MPTIDASSVWDVGEEPTSGVAGFTIPAPSFSALPPDTAALAIPIPTIQSSGSTQTTHSGTSDLSIPLPLISAVGRMEHTGASALTIPLPTMASSGQPEAIPVEGFRWGWSAMSIPVPSIDTTATTATAGTSAFTIPLPTMEAGPSFALSSAAGGNAAFAIPLPTINAGTEHPLVLSKLPALLLDLKWESQVIELKVWDEPPPTALKTHRFWIAFNFTSDDRGLITILRTTLGEGGVDGPGKRTGSAYADFWFIPFWGNTQSDRVRWEFTPKAGRTSYVPGDVTSQGKVVMSFPDITEKFQATQSYNLDYIGTGTAAADRVRIELSNSGWSTGPVNNPIADAGPSLPFYADAPVPPWLSNAKQTGLMVMLNEMAKNEDQWLRPQFQDNPYCYTTPGRSADQERFGVAHTMVDQWCAQDPAVQSIREPHWFGLLRKFLHRPAHHFDKAGNYWDPYHANYNGLGFWIRKFFGSGWKQDPQLGQNWFTPLGAKPDGSGGEAWVTSQTNESKSRKPNIDFSLPPAHHWGLNCLAQVVQRYADPALWITLRGQMRMMWASSNPLGTRGTSDTANTGGPRSRGRSLMAAICCYHGVKDTSDEAQALAHVHNCFNAQYSHWAGTLGKAPVQECDGGGCYYSGWMYGIWGWAIMMYDLTVPGKSVAQSTSAKELATHITRFWLSTLTRTFQNGDPTPGGRWYCWYQSDVTGGPRSSNTGPTQSLTLWSLGTAFHAHYHNPDLTNAEKTKVREALDDHVFSFTSGTPATWHENFEFFYAPKKTVPPVGNSKFYIPLPIINSTGTHGTITTHPGSVGFEIPLPVIAGDGKTTVSGGSTFTIPIPTVVAWQGQPKEVVGTAGRVGLDPDDPLNTEGFYIPIPTIHAAEYDSIRCYTADGNTTDFTIGMPYLDKEHLTVTVNGTSVSWTLIDELTIGLESAPAAGAIVKITRDTPKDRPRIDFSGGAHVKPSDLRTVFYQIVYSSEEIWDRTK